MAEDEDEAVSFLRELQNEISIQRMLMFALWRTENDPFLVLLLWAETGMLNVRVEKSVALPDCWGVRVFF